MIDFVLQNAGVPTGSFNDLRLSMLVKAFHAHMMGTWNDRRKSRQAQAAFVELDLLRAHLSNLRIDDDVKRHRFSFALGQLFARRILVILSQIFDHRDLQRYAYLRSGKANAGSVAHSLAHSLDEFPS